MNPITPSEMKERRGFDAEDVPEFAALATRFNNRLSDMARKGIIKYGERGDLKGKVRLDLSKTYDYYSTTLKEDPLVAWTLKEVMDGWREAHSRRGNWISLNQMFGLGDDDIFKEFVGRDCPRKYVELDSAEKATRERYIQCSIEADNLARSLGVGYDNKADVSLQQVPTPEYKRRFVEYLDSEAIRRNNDKRSLTTIRKHVTEGMSIHNEGIRQVYDLLMSDFLNRNFESLIKPEYHGYKGRYNSLGEIKKAIGKERLDNSEEYKQKIASCKQLEAEYNARDKETSDFKYHSSCKDELTEIKKETNSFCSWMSKEALKNLWRT
jgi:hypothetical protein